MIFNHENYFTGQKLMEMHLCAQESGEKEAETRNKYWHRSSN